MVEKGQLLNDTYEIIERIGSGTGGIIYKAYHTRIKKYVAIKLIKDDVKKELRNRAEVDMLKDLKHEFLPQVIDFIEDGEDVYTVMEFIDGYNFKQLIQSGKRFREQQVRKYALQLCEAVEYLHRNTPPIIHSDIKPANLMLTPKDDICLIDFNISIMTNNGTAFAKGGSQGFAAPEQFRQIITPPAVIDEFHERTRFVDDDETEIIVAEKEYSLISATMKTKNISRAVIDTRTDIYGIGATLYYILTTRTPSDGKLDFRGVNCSSGMREVIVKAMNPIASKRYSSVAELKRALNFKVSAGFIVKTLCASLCAVAAVVGILGAVNHYKNDQSEEDVIFKLAQNDLVEQEYEQAIAEFEAKVTINTDSFSDVEGNDADETNVVATDVPHSETILTSIITEPTETTTVTTESTTTATPVIITTQETAPAISEEVIIGGKAYPVDLGKLDLSKQSLSNKDITELGKLTELYYLDISDNNISDISFLSNMKKMMYLDLSYNSISDFSALKKLDNLKQLVICGNSKSIGNVDFISGMDHLTDLMLNECGITSVSKLKDLPMLTYISLSGNEVSDISSLSGLAALEEVAINYNPVKDLSPLYKLKNLKKVNMFGLFNSKWIDVEHLIEIYKNMPDCLLGVMPVVVEQEDGQKMTDIIYYEGYFHFLDGTVWYNTGFDGNGVPTFIVFDYELE